VELYVAITLKFLHQVVRIYVGWQTFGGCRFEGWVFKGMFKKGHKLAYKSLRQSIYKPLPLGL